MHFRLISVLLLASLPAYTWDVKEWVPQILASAETASTSEHVQLTRACTLVIDHQLHGTVNIKGWNKSYAVFTIEKKGSTEHIDETVVTINKKNLPEKVSCTVSPRGSGKKAAQVKLTVHVPHHTALQVTTRKAGVKTKRLVSSQQLTTHNGPITVKLTTHDNNQAVFAQTDKSPITVKVSKKCNAHLHANSRKGTAASEVLVTLDPQTTKINKEFWHRIKHEISGCIGTGGIPLTLESTNGDITVLAVD